MEKYIPNGEKLGLSGKELLSFVMERLQDKKDAKEKADLIERKERASRRAAEKEERVEKQKLLELERENMSLS